MARKVKFAAVLTLVEDRWKGHILEFPYIEVVGRTQEEVLADLSVQLQAAVNEIKARGDHLPPSVVRVTYLSAVERGHFGIFAC